MPEEKSFSCYFCLVRARAYILLFQKSEMEPVMLFLKEEMLQGEKKKFGVTYAGVYEVKQKMMLHGENIFFWL